MKLFGSSGTRGTVDESLTPEFVLRIAKVTDAVWNTGRVTIARDTRTADEVFINAVESGLAGVDVDVDDFGVVLAPAAVCYCENQAVPGVAITASHDPPESSGVKLVGDDGVEPIVEELERIEDHILAEEFDVTERDTVGSIQSVETTSDDYHENLLVNVDRERIAAANLTVALDPGHGAESLVMPDFLRELGCEVRTVNAQSDGHFSDRQSEPVPENLRDFERLIRATDAGVGVAHDGDANQAVLMNGHGECISGEASLAALATAALGPDDVTVSVVNVSQRLVDVYEKAGTDLELTPIGVTNLVTRIRGLWYESWNVPVTGEGNGGVFYPNYRPVRDGAYVAAKFLKLVAERSASELVAPYENYYNVRTNLEYGKEAELTAMLNAAAGYAESTDATLDTADGYRLDYGGAWVLIRPSGIKSKVRVYAEGRSEERATELAKGTTSALRSVVTTL